MGVTVEAVVSLMSEKNIGCIVITENHIPTGIFTERDLLKRVVSKNLSPSHTFIEDVMTKNPVCVKTSTTLNKVSAAMRLGKFRHLMVVDDYLKARGVISIKDFMNWITDQYL
jgi:CBS domain-containing protein